MNYFQLLSFFENFEKLRFLQFGLFCIPDWYILERSKLFQKLFRNKIISKKVPKNYRAFNKKKRKF